MIDQVMEFVKNKIEFESSGHDYKHALRVYHNAMKIAEGMEVNINVIGPATLIHDLIDHKLEIKYKVTIAVLKESLFEFGYDLKDIDLIIEIIQSISFSSKLIPTSIEGQIVQDADRLDALGAIGIARTFSYGGKNNRLIYGDENKKDSVSHFYQKLLTLVPLMNTETAKKIAIKRTIFMKDYLIRLNNEIDGNE